MPHADVVTTTIHKTLCGPRSGMILCREEHAKAIDKAVFPGQQGGPLMHTIAAKAVALKIAASEQFRARQRQTIANAQAFAAGLEAGGVPVLTGGTDVHLVLVDLTPSGLDGQTAEDRLEEVGITVNRNAIPFDERPPMNPSGLRIGTPALTTRGMVEDDMREIAEVIVAALSDDFESQKDALAERTKALMDRYPLYPSSPRRSVSPRLLTDADACSLRRLRSGAQVPSMKVWVDCTAAAHPLVLRPIIERLRGARGRGLRHRARVRADRGRAGAARHPVHLGRQARRRLDAAARRGRWPGARRGLARLVWERRPDLAIAHGSVDLAVVSALFRIPSAQMQDYEFAGLQRQISFRRRAAGARPRLDPARAAAQDRREGAQAGPLSRASRRSTTWPTSSPTPPSSTSSASTARRSWSSSGRRRRPPPTTPATTSTARRSGAWPGRQGAQAVVIPRTEAPGRRGAGDRRRAT